MITANWYRYAAGFVIATTLTITPLHAEKKWLTLKPSSSWNIHYAKDSCTLQRVFGTDSETTILRFNTY